MKKILFQILILVPILSYASDIEQNMSYQIAGITYTEYGIHGNGEKCSVTYDEDNSFASTTCLSITNSKGIKILCTQKKKMCKTEQELLDFVSPSKIDNKSNNNIGVLEHWVNAHNTQDMNELKNLYSTEITYYGKKLLRTKCIKDKKEFFVSIRNSKFVQTIFNTYLSHLQLPKLHLINMLSSLPIKKKRCTQVIYWLTFRPVQF